MDNNKNIEVELRAKISTDEELKTLQSYCERQCQLTSVETRFLIDYSTFLEGVRDRKRDIRIRSTNGKREIIAKAGGLNDASRQEAIAEVDVPSFAYLTTVMALMGFNKGVAAIRKFKRYQDGNVEIAIAEVCYFNQPSEIHSRFVEFETMASKEDQAKVEKRLRQHIQTLQLDPLEGEEWYEYIEQLNRDANGVFEYGKTNWGSLDKF